MFVDDFGVEFVGVEVLSKDVGKSPVEVRVMIEKEVDVFRCEGQIGDGDLLGIFTARYVRDQES